jgi:hypothetical protein
MEIWLDIIKKLGISQIHVKVLIYKYIPPRHVWYFLIWMLWTTTSTFVHYSHNKMWF